MNWILSREGAPDSTTVGGVIGCAIFGVSLELKKNAVKYCMHRTVCLRGEFSLPGILR